MQTVIFKFLKYHQERYALTDEQYKLISHITELEASESLASFYRTEVLLCKVMTGDVKLNELLYNLSVLAEKDIIIQDRGDISLSPSFSKWLNQQLNVLFPRVG